MKSRTSNRTRCAHKLQVTYKGKKVYASDLAEQFGLKYVTFYTRYTQAGRPIEVSETLLRPAEACKQRNGYIMDGAFYSSFEQIGKRIGVSPYWVSSRVAMLDGKREFTLEELRAIKPKKQQPKSERVHKTGGSRDNKLYLDPNYLPHIKLGDLAHLSDKLPNTGAGKGELPDDYVCGRRDSMAVARVLMYRPPVLP